MKQLSIKPEYKGLTITKKIFTLQASITLDTTKFLNQEELESYYRFEEFRQFIEMIDIEEETKAWISPEESTIPIIRYRNVESEIEKVEPIKNEQKKRGRKKGSNKA